MQQFVDLITRIIKEGTRKEDRTGTGTVSIFGHQSTYNMDKGFPLLTLKRTYYRGIFHELLWFLNAVPEKYKDFGNTNIRYLVDNKVNIWNEWPHKNYNEKNPDSQLTLEEYVDKIKNDDDFAFEWGDLGPVYGKQWTAWEPPAWNIEGGLINQVDKAIDQLKNNPDSRRIIVSAWNPGEIDQMLLPPCHAFFQFCAETLSDNERYQLYNVKMRDMGWALRAFDDIPEDELSLHEIPSRRLNLQLYQRSADVFLGVPFNIASYALLLHMVSQVVNMKPGNFVHTMGDAHLYMNHENQVNEFLSRTDKDCEKVFDYFNNPKTAESMLGSYEGPPLPTLKLDDSIKNIEDFRMEHINVVDYTPLKTIKAPVAI